MTRTGIGSRTVSAALHDEEHSGYSRRTVLKGGAATGALLALGRMPARAMVGGGTLDECRLLVSYFSNGFRWEDYQDCLAVGHRRYLAKHLKVDDIDDTEWDSLEAQFQVFPLDEPDLTALIFGPPPLLGQGPLPDLTAIDGLIRGARMLRAFMTEKQGLEVWTEYWSEHHMGTYGGDIGAGQTFFHLPYVQRMRGLYKSDLTTMLREASQSASMLLYLDGHTSIAGGPPNENFARELVELYTVGLPNFPGSDAELEAAVKEIARIMTGWTFDGSLDETPSQVVNFGEFAFNSLTHDTGQKSLPFLNKSYGGPGELTGLDEGEDMLACLAAFSGTHKNLAQRLCRWFLSDTPPQSLIDRVEVEIAASSGGFPDIITALFDKNEYANWDPQSNPLFMRSSKWFYWTLRALNLKYDPTATGSSNLVTSLSALGNTPGDNRAPNGYQPGADANKDTLLNRWAHAIKLVANDYQNVQLTTTALDDFFENVPVADVAMHANERLTGGLLTTAEIDAIQGYYDTVSPGGTDAALREVLALTYCSPSAQWLCG